ncbi:hypothetical protein AVEN_158138-1 [Araneus ventricosus]|uniref:Uncharacterized protein n=1 Tax=Araneus ventricosus TaxID=182803 RepID=A0A4Y2Q2C6_ARAVE|nr:hypothetical protein AVEN_158138-1 [Araneus ventricosus]
MIPKRQFPLQLLHHTRGRKILGDSNRYGTMKMEQQESIHRTDLVILSCGQMTERTPEPAPALRISITHLRGGHSRSQIYRAPDSQTVHIYDGIGFRTRNSSTLKPRPYHKANAELIRSRLRIG